MEDLKNKIDNQIEKLKEMILKNESKEDIAKQKKRIRQTARRIYRKIKIDNKEIKY